MKKLFTLLLLAVCAWFAVTLVKPYWDRHWLQRDMDEAALYGTKRSVEEVRRFLDGRMKEKNRNIKGEDFQIDKDKRNTVHVRITYEDVIKISGRTLKILQFTLEARGEETKSSY